MIGWRDGGRVGNSTEVTEALDTLCHWTHTGTHTVWGLKSQSNFQAG